jgi:hypothetical protein
MTTARGTGGGRTAAGCQAVAHPAVQPSGSDTQQTTYASTQWRALEANFGCLEFQLHRLPSLQLSLDLERWPLHRRANPRHPHLEIFNTGNIDCGIYAVPYRGRLVLDR